MDIVSEAHITKSEDEEMDKAQLRAAKKSDFVPPGVAIRHGAVAEDAEESLQNGAGKRKSRGSNGKVVKYTEDGSDEDDDAPLVG